MCDLKKISWNWSRYLIYLLGKILSTGVKKKKKKSAFLSNVVPVNSFSSLNLHRVISFTKKGVIEPCILLYNICLLI